MRSELLIQITHTHNTHKRSQLTPPLHALHRPGRFRVSFEVVNRTVSVFGSVVDSWAVTS